MLKTPAIFTAALATLAILTARPAPAAVIAQHGDWIAAKETENGKPACVMSAEPQKSQGNYSKRGPVYAIVAHRPAEKRIGEVSIQAGYTYKKGAPVTLTIDGKNTFKLFTQGEYAWTYEAADDRKLVAAMRAGSTMVVKGTSSRGTLTTDTYSLKGFTAALNAINASCGVK